MNSAIRAPKLSPEDTARFWAKVNKLGDDECWAWLGGSGRTNKKYPVFCTGGESYIARRIMYSLMVSDMPVEVVRDKCGFKWCVNPKHLAAAKLAGRTKLHGFKPLASAPVTPKYQPNKYFTDREMEE